jgi:2-polyprenyl-3-methyl-5-hydroxy-6-metoxy-1,4-benzoquinol methylase
MMHESCPTVELPQSLLVDIPLRFEEIVEEIVRFTRLERKTVEQRVWMEALQVGWNVERDAQRFQVTPHRFDDRMRTLYCEGEGFIFETLVFWAKPSRQKWMLRAFERIKAHAKACRLDLAELRLLVFGDGVGNDSIFLAQNGLNVDFFDLPGSKTYEFAISRFHSLGFLGSKISAMEAYERCLSGQYDVVISFEVLEHLPDPEAAIRDMARMLKSGGIALISESFGSLADYLPTHLASNFKYLGKTPFLFFNEGMILRWYNTDPILKPMEFVKQGRVQFRDFLSSAKDPIVLRFWLLGRLRIVKKTFKRLIGRIV